MNLGQFIKELRLKNNLTLEQLGDKVGVSKMTISRWESGEIKNMKSDKIEKLAFALGVPVISFFEGWDLDGNKIEQEQITRKEFVKEVQILLTKFTSITIQEKGLMEQVLRIISSYQE